MPTYVPDATWGALLPAALAGTHRSPAPPTLPGLTPPLQAEAAAAEKSLLLTAASLRLVRRAGQRPATGRAKTPRPAEGEQWPAAGPAVAQLLRQLLDTGDAQEVLRGLVALYEARQRLPASLLAPVLKLLADNAWPHVTKLLTPVLGRRGLWVASLHPALHHVARYAIYYSVSFTAEATHTEWAELWRIFPDLALCETIRAWPAAPDELKQQLVLHAWEAGQANCLPAELTAALASVLAQPASLAWTTYDHLPQLLAQVPGHPCLAQCWQQVVPCLAPTRDAAGMLRLVVHLANLPGDAGRQGDSLHPVPWPQEREEYPQTGFQYLESTLPENSPDLARQVAWLGRRLSLLPPQRWAEAWHLTPAQLLDLVPTSSYPDLLWAAWLHATALHRDLEFARALLARVPRRPNAWWPWEIQVALLLPEPELLAWAEAQLPAGADFPAENPRAVEWPAVLSHLLPRATLAAIPWPWQRVRHPAWPALRERLLALVARLAAHAAAPTLKPPQRQRLHALVQHLGAVAEVSLLPAAEAALGPLAAGNSFIAPDLQALLATLRQRQALRAALAVVAN